MFLTINPIFTIIIISMIAIGVIIVVIVNISMNVTTSTHSRTHINKYDYYSYKCFERIHIRDIHNKIKLVQDGVRPRAIARANVRDKAKSMLTKKSTTQKHKYILITSLY